jgi:hypothetical protein
MTNLAIEAINARCGVRLDPDETPDDRKLSGFG